MAFPESSGDLNNSPSTIPAGFGPIDPACIPSSLTSDDGSRLYIDDQPIVDNGGVHAVREKTGQIAPTDGIHRIRVSYFQTPDFMRLYYLESPVPARSHEFLAATSSSPHQIWICLISCLRKP